MLNPLSLFSHPDQPLEMKKIDEMNIEICSISDDEFDDPEDELNEPQSNAPMTSATDEQSQIIEKTPRASKLTRVRAPVNQTKQKDSDTILMETSLMEINASPLLPTMHVHSSSIAATAIASSFVSALRSQPSTSHQPPIAQSTMHQQSVSLSLPSTSTAIASTSRQIISPPMPSTSSSAFHRDGHTAITIVQPASVHQTITNFEPELVLSPAKLGQ